MATNVNGVLLLYHHPEGVNAATIMEHVEAFGKHSRFRVWKYNTDAGFPRALGDYRFGAIVLHYSLFGPLSYRLDDYFLSYLDGTSSYKIAFFQDEHHYCRDRFEFLDRHRIDCVYTLVEPANWPQTYGKYTKVENLVYNVPGYVSDDLVRHAAETAKPDEEREIDIGYRGRTLLPYMGRGSQEKARIGTGFLDHARDSGLVLDIAVDEDSRIYGDAWFHFLANCRGVLGVEAGVSIFDVEDVVPDRVGAIGQGARGVGGQRLLPHGLAAALRGGGAARLPDPLQGQVLGDPRADGALHPAREGLLEHRRGAAPVPRSRGSARLTENAHRDLIASGLYTYERFVEEFDTQLVALGLEPEVDSALAGRIAVRLARGARHLRRVRRADELIHYPFRGRQYLSLVLHPIVKRLRAAYLKWRYSRFVKGLSSKPEG